MGKDDLKYSGFGMTALTYKGSVIKHVLPKTIFFILWTLLFVLIQQFTGVDLSTHDTLINLMTLVLSLLLVFRTNTAYDRYWEGRRLWSTMHSNLRSMARLIWVHMAETEKEKDRADKIKAIKLMIAFPYTIKNYLREEYDTKLDNIAEMIAHIPRYATPSSLEQMVEDLPSRVNDPHVPLQPIRSNDSGNSRNGGEIPTNLPLEIAFHLSTFVADVAGKNKIAVPVNSLLIGNINGLVDCLSGFERILRTPIPTAYSVHLNQLIWIFCLTLPFQLFKKFLIIKGHDWVTIPIVAVTVFTSFGIINIGEEIENPFGYDDNDLPLDEYCKSMKLEMEAMVKLPPPNVALWTLAHPLSPTSPKNSTLGGIGFVAGDASDAGAAAAGGGGGGDGGADGDGLVPQLPLTASLVAPLREPEIDFGFSEGYSEHSSLKSKSSLTPLNPSYQPKR